MLTVWKHFLFRSHSWRYRMGKLPCLLGTCWHWMFWQPDIQHTPGSWFSFSVSVCALTVCVHLFLDLMEASTLGRALVFKNLQSGETVLVLAVKCPLFLAFRIIQGDTSLHFLALRNVYFLEDCLGFKRKCQSNTES